MNKKIKNSSESLKFGLDVMLTGYSEFSKSIKSLRMGETLTERNMDAILSTLEQVQAKEIKMIKVIEAMRKQVELLKRDVIAKDRKDNASLDKKILPVLDVYSHFETKGTPKRTFQWYVSKGYLPPPLYEGRRGFYYFFEQDTISILVNTIKQINKSKKLKLANYNSVVNLYHKNWKNRGNFAAEFYLLLDIFKTLNEVFPIEILNTIEGQGYNIDNDILWKETFEKLVVKQRAHALNQLLGTLLGTLQGSMLEQV